MPALWFVMPVHGRLPLAAICLRQLHRTCLKLRSEGVAASAVVVADDHDLAYLAGEDDAWYATVPRDNDVLGRKFNDGIQLATDPRFNPAPADYVVPCGSDDWVDHRLFLEPLPAANEIHGFKELAFVNEDGSQLSTTTLNYEGGAGIRVIPRELVAPLGYRPADEDRRRGIDTSILINLRRHHGDALRVRHWHVHDHQIVDWKTPELQLNPYDEVVRRHVAVGGVDPFEALAGVYPDEALTEMRGYYAALSLVAA